MINIQFPERWQSWFPQSFSKASDEILSCKISSFGLLFYFSVALVDDFLYSFFPFIAVFFCLGLRNFYFGRCLSFFLVLVVRFVDLKRFDKNNQVVIVSMCAFLFSFCFFYFVRSAVIEISEYKWALLLFFRSGFSSLHILFSLKFFLLIFFKMIH